MEISIGEEISSTDSNGEIEPIELPHQTQTSQTDSQSSIQYDESRFTYWRRMRDEDRRL